MALPPVFRRVARNVRRHTPRCVKKFRKLTIATTLWDHKQYAAAWLAGCSSAPVDTSKTTAGSATAAQAGGSSNPVAKYLELAGFRLDEKAPGTVQIRFALINHSDADLGDVTLQVNLRATTARSSDPALFSFPVTVKGVGPGDVKDVSVTAPTKLRIYELPDWQFLHATFEITSPAP